MAVVVGTPVVLKGVVTAISDTGAITIELQPPPAPPPSPPMMITITDDTIVWGT